MIFPPPRKETMEEDGEAAGQNDLSLIKSLIHRVSKIAKMDWLVLRMRQWGYIV